MLFIGVNAGYGGYYVGFGVGVDLYSGNGSYGSNIVDSV